MPPEREPSPVLKRWLNYSVLFLPVILLCIWSRGNLGPYRWCLVAETRFFGHAYRWLTGFLVFLATFFATLAVVTILLRALYVRGNEWASDTHPVETGVVLLVTLGGLTAWLFPARYGALAADFALACLLLAAIVGSYACVYAAWTAMPWRNLRGTLIASAGAAVVCLAAILLFQRLATVATAPIIGITQPSEFPRILDCTIGALLILTVIASIFALVLGRLRGGTGVPNRKSFGIVTILAPISFGSAALVAWAAVAIFLDGWASGSMRNTNVRAIEQRGAPGRWLQVEVTPRRDWGWLQVTEYGRRGPVRVLPAVAGRVGPMADRCARPFFPAGKEIR